MLSIRSSNPKTHGPAGDRAPWWPPRDKVSGRGESLHNTHIITHSLLPRQSLCWWWFRGIGHDGAGRFPRKQTCLSPALLETKVVDRCEIFACLNGSMKCIGREKGKKNYIMPVSPAPLEREISCDFISSLGMEKTLNHHPGRSWWNRAVRESSRLPFRFEIQLISCKAQRFRSEQGAKLPGLIFPGLSTRTLKKKRALSQWGSSGLNEAPWGNLTELGKRPPWWQSPCCLGSWWEPGMQSGANRRVISPPGVSAGIHEGWKHTAASRTKNKVEKDPLKDHNYRARTPFWSSSLFVASQGFELQEDSMSWSFGEVKPSTDAVPVSRAALETASALYGGLSPKLPGCGNSPGTNLWAKPQTVLNSAWQQDKTCSKRYQYT